MAEIVSVGVRRAARDDSCLFSAVRAAVGDDDEAPRRRRCCARAETPADALRRRCADYVGARPKRFDEAAPLYAAATRDAPPPEAEPAAWAGFEAVD